MATRMPRQGFGAGTEGCGFLAGVAPPAGSAGRRGHGFSGAAGLCPVAERGGHSDTYFVAVWPLAFRRVQRGAEFFLAGPAWGKVFVLDQRKTSPHPSLRDTFSHRGEKEKRLFVSA